MPDTTPVLTPRTEPPRLGAQHVHLRNGQVIARNHQIEIVFKRQIDGVVQRQIELAVAHQRIEARGVGQAGRRHGLAAIGVEGVARGALQLVEGDVAPDASARRGRGVLRGRRS